MPTPGRNNPAFYCFDDVVVDREGFRVLKGGLARTLEPRAFDLLLFLLDNRGRLLEKQTLFEHVWKDAFVTDNALTRAVKEIRRAVGDDASAPRYIETVPKRGYRFIAEVKTPATEATKTVPEDAALAADGVAAHTPAHTPEAAAAAFNYKILRKLGQGGGGVVYLAEDARLQRMVVLKFLSAELVADARARRRFLREARLASMLDHANVCAIHEINEAAGFSFIVMQHAEGETLKEVINNKPLDFDAIYSIALQVADALRTAHERGIIHRDIKPGNIIVNVVNGEGRVKVLDFGLAKAIAQERSGEDEATDLTQQGALLGTPAYMSPEQARGERADHRSDIFSFGVVLYEMATGRKPFEGRSQPETLNAVINTPHTPVNSLNREMPTELAAIIDRALAKDPATRYQSMREMQDDLRRLVSQCDGLRDSLSARGNLTEAHISGGRQNIGSYIRRRFAKATATPAGRKKLALVVIAVLPLVVTSSALFWRGVNIRWAKNALPRLEQLSGEQKYFEAYELARQVTAYLPDDATVARLLPTISDTITVITEPAGARAYLRRFVPGQMAAESGEREYIGTTPISDLRVARGEYILALEKDGYVSAERTVSNVLSLTGSALVPPDAPSNFQIKLVEAESAPPRMVFVPGGSYKLASGTRMTDASVQLHDFFIDKYEVTNREYKEFVTSGGYFKRDFWRHPFVKDGKALAWEEAIKEFRDRTGLPGPRGWTGQNFPEGKAEHPVTDITWYEAAAYAAFRGKQLPDIFQWEKAARNGLFTHYSGYVLPWGSVEFGATVEGHANFNSGGTAPVDHFAFGMSSFGCYQMAGNVSEWCLTEVPNGFTAAGGSWGDLLYVFTDMGAFPGFYSSNKLGFRCALNAPDAASDPLTARIADAARVPEYVPTSEQDFNAMLRHYHYDKPPLDARTVEVKETDEWRREKITYVGARDERVIAYLYLPRASQPPYQVIQYVPAGDVFGGYLTIAESAEMQVAPFIKSGRALWAVVFKGFKEREHPADYVPPRWSTVKRREEVVGNATDLRRGLDYLATREDIDLRRLAFYGYSQGVEEGLMYPAVEDRYGAVVLVAGGVPPRSLNWIAEASPVLFASHIRAPKLMLNGRYDEVFPLKTCVEPLFKLFREPKRQYLCDSGHSPPLEIIVPVINTWLDETLGAVRRD